MATKEKKEGVIIQMQSEINDYTNHFAQVKTDSQLTPITEADDILLNYICSIQSLQQTHNTLPELHYKGLNDFLLKEGKFYESITPTSEDIKNAKKLIKRLGFKPQKKNCFYNSQNLSLSGEDKGIKYIEGHSMCISGLPMAHGFNLINGKVFDVTWDYNGEMVLGTIPEGWSYCGVEFSVKMIRTMWAKSGEAQAFIDYYGNSIGLFKTKYNKDEIK